MNNPEPLTSRLLSASTMPVALRVLLRLFAWKKRSFGNFRTRYKVSKVAFVKTDLLGCTPTVVAPQSHRSRTVRSSSKGLVLSTRARPCPGAGSKFKSAAQEQS